MLKTQIVELFQNQEFYLEVNESQKVSVTVEEGLAEIRGRELVKKVCYTFTDTKLAIFTFTGCKLVVEDPNEPEIRVKFVTVTSSTPDTFTLFDRIKDKEDYNILLLGNGSIIDLSIKLANYFVRYHSRVRVTEIDPGLGMIFPGCLSTIVVDGVFTDEFFELNNPFILFYGSASVAEGSTSCFFSQLKTLQEKIAEKEPLGRTPARKTVNLILGFRTDDQQLDKIVDLVRADEIVVAGDEIYYHQIRLLRKEIQKTFIVGSGSGIHLQPNLPKSIKRYFHGTLKDPLTVSRILLNKNTFTLIKLKEDNEAPESALPLGTTRKRSGEQNLMVEADLLENVLIAISSVDNKEEAMVSAPVQGFVVCIDEKNWRFLTCQSKLPKNCNYLIQGEIKYIDY